ncbi:MAG TPA: hypothetical protein VJ732_04645, partial [Bryobacteraceae bacterium]|nr:hypothetical protein [Bryobacteraceae bacterium]
MRRLIPLLVLASLPLVAGPASDLARAIRENSLDRGECYRVRDLTLVKGDIRIYLTDGYLIFGKPVMGRPIAAVFTTDVENGDGEVLLLPPTLAERRSLASFTGVPNLDDHFQDAIFLFTGDVYHALLAELPENPTNRKVPEMGALLEERWNPVLRTISESYDTRLTLELMNGAARKPDLFTGLFHSPKLGNFDLIYDPDNPDQIAAGQVSERAGRTYFDIWTQFPARSARTAPAPPHRGFTMSDFRIQATIQPDLTLDAVTRVKVRTDLAGAAAVPFEIAEEMRVSRVTVQGAPAEVLQRDELRSNIGRGANSLFLVVPSSPLRPGADYEFEFHHSGKIILESGDRVFYVTARGNWYPTVGQHFATFDLTFRYPRNLDLVTPGDVVEDRTEGDWRITRRRPSPPIRLAGFNLGSYVHARVSRGGFQVDVCANRALEPELQ